MEMLEGLSKKPKMPRGMKDARKHKITHTMIEHHHDGTHKVTHHHMNAEPTTHGANDLESLQDHLQEMLGGKPTSEEMA